MIHRLKAIINFLKSWKQDRRSDRVFLKSMKRRKKDKRNYAPMPKVLLPGWDEAYIELETGERIKLCDIDRMGVERLPDDSCNLHYGLKSGNGARIIEEDNGESRVVSDVQEHFPYVDAGIGKMLEIRSQQSQYGII